MNTIQSEWEDLSKKVLSPKTPLIQRQAMMRVFYGGAASVLHILFSLAVENASEEAAAMALNNLLGECNDFLKERQWLNVR